MYDFEINNLKELVLSLVDVNLKMNLLSLRRLLRSFTKFCGVFGHIFRKIIFFGQIFNQIHSQ